MVATLSNAVDAWIHGAADGDGDAAAIFLLRRCIQLRRLREAETVRLHLAKSGRDLNRPIQHLLLQLYGKCGKLEEAYKVFQAMGHSSRNSASYNLMIAAYARNGHLQEARSTFEQMPFPDLVSWNTVIAAYAREGRTKEAYDMFQRMPTRDVVSWNTMISAYAQRGHWKQALQLLERLQQPDASTFVGILNACVALGSLEQGRVIHSRVLAAELDSDSKVAVSLVNMYGKCGSPEDARIVFDNMPSPGLVAWNAMASAYAHSGHLLGAKSIFDEMPERDIVSWNLMLTAYVQSGHAQEALELFHVMEEQPDDVTLLSVLEACSCLRDATEGRAVHSMIPADAGVKVRNALITMYGKCGSPTRAREVFDSMGRDLNSASGNAMLAVYTQNGHLHEAQVLFEGLSNRDVITWNTMLAALVQSDHERDAIELFYSMDCEPSSVTFVCLLGACSSLGALTEGRLFHRMIVESGHGSDTSVQNAVMSMYAKCGRLQEAMLVFQGMASRDVVSWNGMLTAFAQNGQVEDARTLFEAMPQRDVVSWNSMITAYAQNGRTLALSGAVDMQQQAVISRLNLPPGIEVYQTIPQHDLLSYVQNGQLEKAAVWNTMICGHLEQAVETFRLMLCEGESPDGTTFLVLLSACSHAGLLLAGWRYFRAMRSDFVDFADPWEWHYACMVDLLARSGKLLDAKELVSSMPFNPDSKTWLSFLGGCGIHDTSREAARAAWEASREMDPSSSAPYILAAKF